MSIKFVELAICKDKSRYNLQEVYRDTDKLIATDGHRLHFSHAPQIERGHYLSGLDAEFPDTAAVFKGLTLVDTYSLFLDKDNLAAVKAALKFTQVFDKSLPMIKLQLGKQVSIKFETVTANYRLDLGICAEELPQVTLNLNLRYLLDAIELPVKDRGTCPITIKYHGDLNPIIIEHHIGSALIMPCKG